LSLSDSIRRFFSKKANPDLRSLEAFAGERKGVEGYIEPKTTTQSTTLLLVDRQGDSLRGAVRDPEDAAAFCEKRGIPVYDAAVVGYPRRMREFDKGRRVAIGEDIDEQIAEIERRMDDTGPPTPDD
jgi:hypothetical protein